MNSTSYNLPNTRELSFQEFRRLLTFLPPSISGIARFAFPLNGTDSYADPGVAELVGGLAADNLLSHLQLPGIVHADDLSVFLTELSDVIASNEYSDSSQNLRIIVNGLYQLFLLRLVKQIGQSGDWVYGELSLLEQESPQLEVLEALVEHFVEAACLLDEQGRVLAWNGLMAQLTGLEADAALNTPVWDLMYRFTHFPGLTLAAAQASQERLLNIINLAKSGTTGSYESVVRLTTDSEKAMYLEQITIPIVIGDSVQLFAILRNVSIEQELQLALEESDANMRSILEGANAIFWTGNWQTDGSFKYHFVSPQVARLGYSADGWVGDYQEWFGNILPDDQQMVASICQTATAELKDHEFEYRIRSADGQIRWMRDFVRVVPQAAGPAQLLGVMVDITDKREAERVLQIKMDLARKLSSLTNPEEAFAPGFHALLDTCNAHSGIFYSFEHSRMETSGNVDAEFLDCLTSEGSPLAVYLKQIRGSESDSHIAPLYLNPEAFPALQDYELRSLYAIPVRSNSAGIIGCIIVTLHDSDILSEFLVASAESLTDHLGESLARMESEKALIDSLANYRNLFESMQEGVVLCTIIYDEAGKPIDVKMDETNTSYARRLHTTPDGLANKTIRDIYREVGRGEIGEIPYIDIYDRVARGEVIEPFETEFDGRTYRAMAYTTKPGQFALVLSDITE